MAYVGDRAIEMMETTAGGNTTQVYPLYDTHGNMVATLSKNTAGTSWSLGNERSYDVWGSVRSGAVTGGPKGRHVANLGHVADDESGLIYMRARYYEPESGRFVSEDPSRDGKNWFVYCGNSPTLFVDATGLWFSAEYVLGILMNAFEEFSNCNVRGYGTADVRAILLKYRRALEEIIDVNGRFAKEVVDDLIADAYKSRPPKGAMGEVLQQNIDKLKQGVASWSLTSSTTARIAIYQIDLMIMMLDKGVFL